MYLLLFGQYILTHTDASHRGLCLCRYQLSLRTGQTHSTRGHGESDQGTVFRISRAAGLRVVHLLGQSLNRLDCAENKE